MFQPSSGSASTGGGGGGAVHVSNGVRRLRRRHRPLQEECHGHAVVHDESVPEGRRVRGVCDGTASAGGNAAECTASSSASSPGPPASSPGASTPSPSPAQGKKETAEKTRDSILADIADPALKKKAKLLADAAIAGETVQRLSAKLSAADADAACASAYSKGGGELGQGRVRRQAGYLSSRRETSPPRRRTTSSSSSNPPR